MTETPHQSQAPHEGVDTEHLRDYSELRRSVTERKIAGVAGGLGRHLNVDPTILRVAFVVLCFFGGAGFVLYGAAWLLVPEEGRTDGSVATSPGTRNALLIAAGVVAALLLIGDSWGGFWFPWPLAIIALVVFVVLMNRDKPMNTTPPPGQWTGQSPRPGGTATYPAAGPADTEPTTQFAPQPPSPPWMPPSQQSYPSPTPRPDRGPKLFWVTLAMVAIALGTLGLFDVAGVEVTDSAYPALALAVVGLMLVLGAWVGRAGGLILLGILSAIALVATSVTSPSFDGDRRIDISPQSAAAVHQRYYVPAGGVYVDLRDVADVANLDGRTIELEANAGELIVILPDNVSADVHADIDVAGSASIGGRTTDGTNIDVDQRVEAAGTEQADLDIELDLVVGHIEVRQS